MLEDEEYPVLYLLIYEKIKRKANGFGEISQSDLNELIRRMFWQIPHRFFYHVINELEVKYKFIKRVNHAKFTVTGRNADKILNRYADL